MKIVLESLGESVDDGMRLLEVRESCHARFWCNHDSSVMFESLFSERGLSLDRLKVLIEVRDAGSIAQAAPGDPVRQSQYSRQLRELSEFFGCEVAQRKGKLLKLTSQGERLAELAREHLRSLDDFRAECRDENVAFTIGAGDSLIQWLVIPALGSVTSHFPGTRFATSNLRTNEIVQQVTDCRVDFGIIRKNAVAPGLKSVSLGLVSYAALVPSALWGRRKKMSLREFLGELPLATQTTDGQFTAQLREIAKSLDVALAPALACQSFPQTMAAVKSGRFVAVVPELALRDFPSGSVHQVPADELKQLAREAMLVWNPRLVRIRPNASKIALRLQHSLAI
jgi:DNA-binding transcriptional LysR family regulator